MDYTLPCILPSHFALQKHQRYQQKLPFCLIPILWLKIPPPVAPVLGAVTYKHVKVAQRWTINKILVVLNLLAPMCNLSNSPRFHMPTSLLCLCSVLQSNRPYTLVYHKLYIYISFLSCMTRNCQYGFELHAITSNTVVSKCIWIAQITQSDPLF